MLWLSKNNRKPGSWQARVSFRPSARRSQVTNLGMAATFEFDFIQLLAFKAIADPFVALFADQDPIWLAQS